MSDGLAARVRHLEDRAEIEELIARYAVAVDDRDFDTLTDMFTNDAIFHNVRGIEQGRDKVIAYYRERLGEFGPTYHIPHARALDFGDEDHARGIVMAHAELAIGNETYMVALRYYDRYRREQGRWRFHERKVRQLYAMPMAELPRGLAKPLRKRWPGAAPAAADLPPADVLTQSSGH